MKATGIVLLLLVWQTGFSQINDTFEDGNFSVNPTWSGTATDFSVIDGILQLAAAPVSSSSFLATTSSSIDNATWQFRIKMAFNPSSSNYSEVYLVADSPDLTGAINGYLVRVGWTTDNVSLLRQDGSTRQMLIEGLAKRLDLNNVDLIVRVTRTFEGQWQLWSRLANEPDWFSEGIATDRTHVQTDFFGLKCTYTPTRSDKFGFDDITVSGTAYVDREAPAVDTVFSTSESALMVKLSEAIDVSSAVLEGFSLNGENPEFVEVLTDSIRLSFVSTHQVDNILVVQGLRDLSGNTMMVAEESFIHYSFELPKFGSIVFNEIMPDPSPPIDLPELEYVEITNPGPTAILMTGWSFSDRATQIELPTIKLKPDSLVVLCLAEDKELLLVKNTVGLDKWPSLNNFGDEIWLRDRTGKTIDYLEYDLSLYGHPEKALGGWSLERLDPDLPCSGTVNWLASESIFGGTPGKTNSVFQRIIDNTPPELSQAYALHEDSLLMAFSEPLGNLPVSILIPDLEILQVDFAASKDKVAIKTATMTANKLYKLRVNEVADCSDNTTEFLESKFVLPEKPDSADLVINEVLFNPRGNKNDYLEIYNQSARYISLHGMSLSNSATVKPIYSFDVIEPGGYRVFSPHPEEILANYSRTKDDNIIKQELPALSNVAGRAILRNAEGKILDSIIYEEGWHFAYLHDYEGIALERLSPYRSGLDRANWASASSQHNFGTPGYINSQMTDVTFQNEMTITPKVIVPDSNGHDDFTTIAINNDKNALVTLRVYNLQGLEVRMLANNQVLSGVSYFTWDGTDTYGQTVPLGHYIIVADFIEVNGQTRSIKEKLVVGTGY